ncbi:MFS transporter [Kribbella sp. NPDC000426]|uniref:MFS transporter n=1 Tax=Kribbella sp. NPDC000426 TaxID=3154255 RepID=UPI00332731DF
MAHHPANPRGRAKKATTSHSHTRGRRTLPGPVAYAVAAYVIGLGLFGSVAPSPLYETYMELWSFSTLTLTLIYATYSFGVLATLILAGSVSDDLGRRPVLLAALSALMVSTLLFIVASSAAWLFVARGLQGVATGAAVGTASAALLDFAGTRGPAKVSLTNAVVTTTGTGLGILTTAVLVQIAWEPQVVPYLIFLGLLAAAIVGSYAMSEPVESTRRFRLRLERPHVPAGVRGPFILASLAVISSWSAGGLFFSLGPSLGTALFESTNTVVSVLGIVVLLGTAAVAQLAFGYTAPWLGATLGSIALAAGILAIAAATHLGSGATYLVGCSVAGFGFGIAFLGGLRNLLAVIPPPHRASVMSAFYVVAYASLSIPAVIAGLLVKDLGLQRTFQIFGAVVAVIALSAAVMAWASRGASARAFLRSGDGS